MTAPELDLPPDAARIVALSVAVEILQGEIKSLRETDARNAKSFIKMVTTFREAIELTVRAAEAGLSYAETLDSLTHLLRITKDMEAKVKAL